MRVCMKFRPSIVTPWGTWAEITGDLSLGEGVLWVQREEARYGIHLASSKVFRVLEQAKPAQANGKAKEQAA